MHAQRRLPHSDIQTTIGEALREAKLHPHQRSAILGDAALSLASKAQHPEHAHEARQLRQFAEQLAEAAMSQPAEPDFPATTDDFYELLQERNAGHAQFGSDIDVIARAEEIHDQRVSSLAQRVSIAPISWGKGATLGRTGAFKFNPSNEERQLGISQSATLAFWQGEPHEAQAITVDLAPPVDFTPMPLLALPTPGVVGAQDTSTRSYGIISYGSDGAITKVQFDAGFGARITVPGSYVSIVAGMNAPLSGALAGTLSFTASMGAFSAPSMAPVFLTEYIDQLDVGQASAPIQRPMHATQLLPILSNAEGGAAVLRFYGQGGINVLTYFNYPIGQLLNPIPLTAEVQYVVLTNGTGAVANFRVMFQLSL